MIIVKLIGGLGNQMFQYALGKYLAVKHDSKLKLDLSGFESYKAWKFELDNLNVQYESYNPDEITSLNYIQEKQFHFDSDMLNLSDNVHLDGYWQSEKYFKEIEEYIRKDFSVVTPINKENQSLLDLINSTNSVSLHVRRGDYITNPSANAFHGTCSLDYYNKSVEHIIENIDNPHFFLFSDESEWVKDNILINKPVTVVDINTIDNGYDDLRLMYNCKHNIIANSSFSWWAAWLNNNPQKIVIAPDKWFLSPVHDTKDLIPQGWIKL
ncbi:MAG: alpha-1,2-fucosyltransferase [Candidatus Gastranaerophilales bacterium]|nr:alpha-1,2-fucosyltransferase [Candidatus Gastranaerophilales bacterium]